MDKTLLDNGIERLGRLTPMLGFNPEEERRISGIFRAMASGWGEIPCRGRPRFPSDICDDSSPFEFSVAFEGAAPELRILSETWAPRPTMMANWHAALAFTEMLAFTLGLSLDRLRAVQDLFAPTLVTPRFSLWHAACFRPGAPPEIKVYLNPFARGPALSRRLVVEALERLGFRSAWRFLPAESVSVRTIYFGMDLPSSGGGRASSPPRVKVYTAYHGSDPAQIEADLRVAGGYVPGRITSFYEAMRGDGAGRRSRVPPRPVQTCLSFTELSAPPTTGTLYFPVRAHADSDFEVRERVLAMMEPERGALYDRVLSAFADRPLTDGVGMQSYVSLRQAPGPNRLTIYLAPEVFSVAGRGRRVDQDSGIVARPDIEAPSRPSEALLSASGEEGSRRRRPPSTSAETAWQNRRSGW
ncbi:MAG: tryptophan dimethylallyltransferase family protein [Polyangiaceae bacterium]